VRIESVELQWSSQTSANVMWSADPQQSLVSHTCQGDRSRSTFIVLVGQASMIERHTSPAWPFQVQRVKAKRQTGQQNVGRATSDIGEISESCAGQVHHACTCHSFTDLSTARCIVRGVTRATPSTKRLWWLPPQRVDRRLPVWNPCVR
jgi:hypothetical protein